MAAVGQRKLDRRTSPAAHPPNHHQCRPFAHHPGRSLPGPQRVGIMAAGCGRMENLVQTICSKEGLKIREFRALSGGQVNQVFLIDDAYVLRIGAREDAFQRLKRETELLQSLINKIPVPKIFAFGQQDGFDLPDPTVFARAEALFALEEFAAGNTGSPCRRTCQLFENSPQHAAGISRICQPRWATVPDLGRFDFDAASSIPRKKLNH